MIDRLCFNYRTNRYEKCPETTKVGAQGSPGPPRDCLSGCSISFNDLIRIILPVRSLTGYIMPLTSFTTSEFITFLTTVNPDVTFSGNNMSYLGNPTGYTLTSVTNAGQTLGASGTYYFQAEFAGNGCPDFNYQFRYRLVRSGANFEFVPITVNPCFGPFGAVVPAFCETCTPNYTTCLPNPVTPVNATISIPPLSSGVTDITLPADLLQGENSCCVFKSITTSVPLLEADLISPRVLRFTNYGSDVPNDFEIIIWTTCGPLNARITVEVDPNCNGILGEPPGAATFLSNARKDGTGSVTIPIRFTDLVVPSDPCCQPLTFTTDVPDITVSLVGLNLEYTINDTGYPTGTHFFNTIIESADCGILTRTTTFNITNNTCSGLGTVLEDDLNVLVGIPTISIPAGGSVTLNILSDMYSNSNPCCGSTVTPAPNLSQIPNVVSPLTDIEVSTLVINGLTGGTITLASVTGATPGSPKTETIRLQGNCVDVFLNITYQII